MTTGNKMLSDAEIRALKAKKTRYEISEPGGLRIRVSPSGKKTWVYVYRLNDKLSRMTLGTYPNVPLVKARAAAATARAAKHDGTHPAASAVIEKREKRLAPLVEELAKQFLEKHSKLKKKSWAEDQRILEKDILPRFGKLRARDLRRRDVIAMLEDIAIRAPVSANRTLEVLRKMYNWAVEREIVETNPCWQVSRPSSAKKRDRVLASGEIKPLWRILGRNRQPDSDELGPLWPSLPIRLAIKLALVTGQRRGEIAGAKKEEFDLDAGWWTIRSERAKNNLAHRVPLSTLAVAILSELFALSADSPWLLPSPRGNQPVTPRALSRAVSRIREALHLPHWTEHDLRRTAASHMASLGVPRLVIGRILNHVDGGITAIYDRHSYDSEKRDALFLWSHQLLKITAP